MSEMIVLDTHIWIWLVNRNLDNFPGAWVDQLASAQRIGVSPVSCYEIALAQEKGRLKLPFTVQEWFQGALAPLGSEIFPLTPSIAARAVQLSPIHKDPFDRMIIATALEYQAKLASVDGVFSQYTELTGYLMESSG